MPSVRLISNLACLKLLRFNCTFHLLQRGWRRRGKHLEVAQPEFYVLLKNLANYVFGIYVDFQPHKK